jgi:sporulation-control protein
VSKTGGFGGRGQDFLGMFTMKPDVNWEKQLEDWLDQVARPRGIFD